MPLRAMTSDRPWASQPSARSPRTTPGLQAGGLSAPELQVEAERFCAMLALAVSNASAPMNRPIPRARAHGLRTDALNTPTPLNELHSAVVEMLNRSSDV